MIEIKVKFKNILYKSASSMFRIGMKKMAFLKEVSIEENYLTNYKEIYQQWTLQNS